jgi:hypothetical protein
LRSLTMILGGTKLATQNARGARQEARIWRLFWSVLRSAADHALIWEVPGLAAHAAADRPARIGLTRGVATRDAEQGGNMSDLSIFACASGAVFVSFLFFHMSYRPPGLGLSMRQPGRAPAGRNSMEWLRRLPWLFPSCGERLGWWH